MTSHNTPGAILIPRPDISDVAFSPQGQLMVPVLSGSSTGNAPGSPLSAGWPYMRPGWVSNRHRHDETWVMILLWAGRAITRWGPDYEHTILQRPGELVLIPPGVNHVAENASDTDPVLACEVRTSPDISLDNIPLEADAGIRQPGVGRVRADALSSLLDRPSAGWLQIGPWRGDKDESLGRWAH